MGKGKRNRDARKQAQEIAAKAVRSKNEMARQWENHQKAMREHPEQFGYTKHGNAYIEDLVYEDMDFERDLSKNLYAFYMTDNPRGQIQAGVFENIDGSAKDLINDVYYYFGSVNPHYVLVIRLSDGITVEEAEAKIYDENWWRCAIESFHHMSYNGGAFVNQATFEKTVKTLMSHIAA